LRGAYIKIKDFALHIRLSFFVCAAVLAVFGHLRLFMLFVLAVASHEAAHMLTGYLLGATTKSVTVSALGMSANMRGLMFLSAKSRAAVLIAGPAASFLLAAFFSGEYRLICLLIGIINLLPALPTDGGQLISLAAQKLLDPPQADEAVRRISRIAARIVIAVGFVVCVLYPFNISVVVIGLYLSHRARVDIEPNR